MAHALQNTLSTSMSMGRTGAPQPEDLGLETALGKRSCNRGLTGGGEYLALCLK